MNFHDHKIHLRLMLRAVTLFKWLHGNAMSHMLRAHHLVVRKRDVEDAAGGQHPHLTAPPGGAESLVHEGCIADLCSPNALLHQLVVWNSPGSLLHRRLDPPESAAEHAPQLHLLDKKLELSCSLAVRGLGAPTGKIPSRKPSSGMKIAILNVQQLASTLDGNQHAGKAALS